MTTKTITITQDAYDILKSWRSNDSESFSQVIRKIGQKQTLSGFSTVLNEKSAKYLVKSVEKNRELWRKKYGNS